MGLVSVPKREHVGVYRDGFDRPLIVPKKGGTPIAHTRTTTFIDCIEDKSNLSDWKARSVLYGAAKLHSGGSTILDDALALDPTAKRDKQILNAMAEKAQDAAGSHEKREKGTELHGYSELVDAGLALPETASAADTADMAAYMMGTLDFDVLHVEQLVACNTLCVAGTPDRVARYSGPDPFGKPISGTFITDLKTGGAEYGAMKFAMQLAIYSRSEFYDHTVFPIEGADDKKALAAWKKRVIPGKDAELAYKPLPNVNQDWGVIIHLPSGEATCTLYWVDLNIGWKLARLAKTIRAARATRNAMRPFVDMAVEVIAA